jgi:TRAP-type uncharacterized transport system fused permease subunit
MERVSYCSWLLKVQERLSKKIIDVIKQSLIQYKIKEKEKKNENLIENIMLLLWVFIIEFYITAYAGVLTLVQTIDILYNLELKSI